MADKPPPQAIKGRGAAGNAEGRFALTRVQAEDDGWFQDGEPPPNPATTVTEERARSLLRRNDSPDLPFDRSVNAYRGCEHGCFYCFARPSHSYLELSPGLDFETKLFAKNNAVEVLRAELAKPSYRCAPIAMGTNTDPYQPIERRWRITRGIIELLGECRHPFTLLTKNALIERDIDLLAPLAREWLQAHYPERAAHVLSLVRQAREGKDYDHRFGLRQRGSGAWAELVGSRFRLATRKLGYQEWRAVRLDTSKFRPPVEASPQGSLF